jgi:hypothetical protein
MNFSAESSVDRRPAPGVFDPASPIPDPKDFMPSWLGGGGGGPGGPAPPLTHKQQIQPALGVINTHPSLKKK